MNRLICALLLWTVLPMAHAENYAQAGLAYVHLKQDGSAAFSGWELQPEGRYDLAGTPLFLTGELFTGSIKGDVFPGATVTEDFSGAGVGGGWAFVQDATHEINAYARYSHEKDREEVSGLGTLADTSSDQLNAGAGGHIWFSDDFRAFGSLGYLEASHRQSGIVATLGGEFRIRPDVGLFVEYDYDRITDRRNSSTATGDIIGAGAKMTFGGVK